MNFTGDHPVILTVDGPSLGGFICPVTIPRSELWKVGQFKPGDKVKFVQMSFDQAVQAGEKMDSTIRNLKATKANRGLMHTIPATASTPEVTYRIAGDTHLMVDYASDTFDLNKRVRVYELEKRLLASGVKVRDTVPGVKSLLIQFDPHEQDLDELMKVLKSIEASIPDVREDTFQSRILEMPMAFEDRWTRASIAKYAQNIRAVAPYVPSNVEFLARNNGLEVADVKKILYSASYMCMGLGDVYLGAPCAIPVDPRHRLSTPKYNPARTFTPEGAVGIGGSYMCIYPIESPGGYQLVGRTLPIWNTKGDLPNYQPDKPWLLDMFDQVRFFEVSESELETLRNDFAKGTYKIEPKIEQFSMKSYNKFVESVKSETAAFTERKNRGAAAEAAREAQVLAQQEKRNKLLTYLADMSVRGPDHPGAIYRTAVGIPHKVPIEREVAAPGGAPPPGLKQVLEKEGPAGFAKAVRKHKGLLLTDTTWRDAHQSLLATRVRTRDLLRVAPLTSHVLHNLYSLECWGGATFDVALRFLHEDPWARLRELRELVPNVPFQMLLRGANALGYSSYPDNVIYKFCKQAKDNGMDVFRVFDSLNYVDNLRLGINAVGSAGGVVEAVMSYTGDITNPAKTKYTLDYYLNLAHQLVKEGIHVLCIKDMAGLLKPRAATILVSALRKEFPDLPIHVHTHDTAATGVASMLACAHAGADAVDVAIDAMSGLTSQPSMGAIVHELWRTELDTGVDPAQMQQLTSYWELTRRPYEPFEAGRSAGADVYTHEIPGGQYVNLQFQALANGMADEWDTIRTAYASANRLLGDIVKVTPSSKVVGDLAQFMVANGLSESQVLEQAENLSFPASVIDYLQGGLGIPYGGLPEPLRTRVIKDRKRYDERPGLSMAPVDFESLQKELRAKYQTEVSELDTMSHIQFPAVYKDYVAHQQKYGDTSDLPTYWFFHPMEPGQAFTYKTKKGEEVSIKLKEIGPRGQDGKHPVVYEYNGEEVVIPVAFDKVPYVQRGTGSGSGPAKDKVKKLANKSDSNQVGAPMPGRVVDVKVAAGATVEKGQPLLVINAMKMEVTVSAPKAGKIARIEIKSDDQIVASELLITYE